MILQCYLLGDIEEIAEKKLVEIEGIGLDSDILKVAHHGSNSSSIDSFLEAVSPEIATISVGIDNLFGHPSQDVIGRLENHTNLIYRTDENGEITIKVNRNKIVKIDTKLNNDIENEKMLYLYKM